MFVLPFLYILSQGYQFISTSNLKVLAQRGGVYPNVCENQKLLKMRGCVSTLKSNNERTQINKILHLVLKSISTLLKN